MILAFHEGKHVGEHVELNTYLLSEQVRAQIDDAVAGECPFCGELMIKEIAEAFVSSEETDVVSSWSIGGAGTGSISSVEYGLA